MHSTSLTIQTPPNFDFWRAAYSHGWCDLLPFSFNPDLQQISRVLTLNDGKIVSTLWKGKPGSIQVKVESVRPLSAAQKHSVTVQVKTCLRLDEDFVEFHSAAGKHSHYKWIATSNAGRMLRSPTVFEDVVKMICTTNCTWALTKIMVTNLVNQLGNGTDKTGRTFPTPEAIATSSEKVFRKEIKAGYRSPYMIELAKRVASKELDLESWRSSELPTDELFKQMRGVKGIGPYAAGNIMKLIGRYDYLGLDSWVRAKYYELHRNGRTVKDSTIEKHYAQYGKWRGLIFWLEMTRYWHDDKFQNT